MSGNYADALEEKKRKLAELRAKRQNKPKDEPPATGPGSALSPRADDAKPNIFEAAPPKRPNPDDLLKDVLNLIGPSATDQKKDGGGGQSVAAGPRRQVQLAATGLVEQQDVLPVEKNTYEIGIQYPEAEKLEPFNDAEEKDRQMELLREQKIKEREQQEKEEKLKKQREDEERKRKELTAAQKKQLLTSNEFKDFFERTTVLVERALNQNDQYDLTIDYRKSAADEESKKGKNVLSRSSVFFDKGRTFNRPVTSIDWNPQYRELVLASYAQKEDVMSLEPDGLVLVWSTHMTQRPEYFFYCQSAVLSAQFHPSNPKLIIGGTQSGQVVIWDTREKNTPVNRTSLSNGHTHPLYALAAVPTVNLLHNIISLSTDGRMCVWNDNDLVEPTTQIDLQWDKKEVTTNSFSFPGRDTNNVVLGSDEGWIYKARVYDTPGIYEGIEAHSAPITAVRFHPIYKNSPREISDLFLTSSYDWTIKLWSSKVNRPLFTFESAQDYVYDVQWSPVHPALFAAGDGTGSVDFWDLNKDTEVPVHRVHVLTSDDDESKKDTRERSISRLKWADDGKKIAVGSSDGRVMVYDVAPEVYKSSEDDTTVFYEKMRKAAADAPLEQVRPSANIAGDDGAVNPADPAA